VQRRRTATVPGRWLLLTIALLVAACGPEPEPDTTEPDEALTPEVAEDDPGEGEDDPGDVEDDSGDEEDDPGDVEFDRAVSAGDEAAVEAGLSILEAGGSAVDAAIATAFAISVVEPFASGIGGGGATIVAIPGQEPDAFDYREVVADDGVVPFTDTGIPGFAAGMGSLHDTHGELEWEELLAPAITLAGEGVATTGIVADQLRSAQHRLPVADLPGFFPDGVPLDEGESLVQPELAATLQRLADAGPDDLYTGALAEELSTAVEGIDPVSLSEYRVQRDPPARGAFGTYEVVAPAPALPGPAFVQQLQIAEAAGVGELPPDDADHLHRMLMAWRLADASISDRLGDPAFVEVPTELTDAERNAVLADQITDDALLEPGDARSVADDDADEAGNTTHITVVGDDGTVVSMTNTLTNFWGSGEQTLGFFLNDQLRRFSIGGADTNAPEPGRRSVSWGLPVLVLDEQDRAVLGAGSPGGRRIPNILANLLVRWGLHDESLEEAVEAPRFHLEGGLLEFETLPPEDVVDDLLARGYSGVEVPAPVYYFGSVQALEIDPDTGEVTGATDPRRQGTWGALEP
jgi:gamma-glutamyltranspeptidase / glutathione hydrolase